MKKKLIDLSGWQWQIASKLHIFPLSFWDFLQGNLMDLKVLPGNGPLGWQPGLISQNLGVELQPQCRSHHCFLHRCKEETGGRV